MLLLVYSRSTAAGPDPSFFLEMVRVSSLLIVDVLIVCVLSSHRFLREAEERPGGMAAAAKGVGVRRRNNREGRPFDASIDHSAR